ncbi:MAG: radical SAM protein [Kiritimatiellae bacterium]|nr:radical SAM protein [Kiritimatiellia bacterium]
MHLTLHLTDRCNLACRYCYARPGTADMTFETAAAAIDACATGPDCGIIFFGGEPLLCQPLIWQVMDWCRGRAPGRFHFKVTTNGLMMDEAFLAEAARRGLHVALSHDGTRTAHDAFRVRPDGSGTFPEVDAALERLLKHSPYAPVLMTVNPETAGQFAAGVRDLQAKGVQYLIASPNFAGNWTDAALRVLGREFRTLARWHEENYRKERKFYFSPFDKRIASHVRPDRSPSCRLGRRQISVGPDGRLYPCVQFVGRTEYGIGTADAGLDEARRDELYLLNERDKPECAGCALAGRCHNRCGCLNIQTTGFLDRVPAVLCAYERMVIPLADRLAERLYKARNPLFLHRHYNPAFSVLSFLEDLGVS